jgi:hypothetical protein
MNRLIQIPKSYLLAGATALLWLLAVRMAFYPAWQAYQLHARLNQKLQAESTSSYQPALLQRKNDNLKAILTLYRADSTAYRNVMLTTLSAIAEKSGVTVTELPDYALESALGSVKYDVHKVGLEGDFASLTKFYHAAEFAPNIGRIRSARYIMPDRRLVLAHEAKLKLYLFLKTVN